MQAQELTDALRAVPGVANAEVTIRPQGSPLVRVWLDGSRSDTDVGREVNLLIASGGFAAQPQTGPAAPSQPQDRSELTVVSGIGSIESVAIEESSTGLRVIVRTGDGREAAQVIGDGPQATDLSVLAAVAQLVGVTVPRLVTVDERSIEGAGIVTLVLEAAGGRRAAGSAVVVGGRPFAVARAAHAALSGV